MHRAMQTRELGKTGIHLSVIGAGTSQLQMVPQRQAVATLVKAFEEGVNWVHTAPDYGGIDPWIKQAIDIAGRNIMVATGSPPRNADLEAFFENTCHIYATPRLAMYGIAGIEDIEWFGENVWGRGGMVEFLQRKKAEGRLGALYCTTHGSADYVAKLVESGVFDAIMLAWNPLGFHQQSHAWDRAKLGRHHEDLPEFKERIFPLAQERGVSLLVMRPLAGGMLLKNQAFPPHAWVNRDGGAGDNPVHAADVLRLILEMPAVCSVLPGMASVEEVQENTAVGRCSQALPDAVKQRIARLVADTRQHSCNRCGACEPTCSQQLPIPALFRDASIWLLGSETNQANSGENYFDLHPAETLACATCTRKTCLCPHGIDIPKELAAVHAPMWALRRSRLHPGPTEGFATHTVQGAYPVLVLTQEVPHVLPCKSTGVARFLLRNVGSERWLALQHESAPQLAMGIRIEINSKLVNTVALRNTICPDELYVPFAFEFAAPKEPGRYTLQFSLTRLACAGGVAPATTFYTGELVTQDHSATPSRLRTWVQDLIAPKYEAVLVAHSIPKALRSGVTCGVRLEMQNTGSMAWEADTHSAQHVQIKLWVGNVLLLQLPLPNGTVHPGELAVWHTPLRAPDGAGAHTIRVEWVRSGTAQQAEHSMTVGVVDVEVAPSTWNRTEQLFEWERQHNPWHYNPFQGIAQSRDGQPFPLFIERAKGCTVWDAQGHAYIDYTMGWGSTILGHAHDGVQSAIRQALDTGAVLPLPHPLEMEVSRMLVEDFAPHEMVAFGKNGSDVCTIAARLARVTTKKRVILSCGYHGWQDFGLEYFDFEDCGVPYRDERTLYKFKPNDIAGFLALYQRHKDDLAAIMVEPAGALIDDVVGLAGEADADFLHIVADAAKRANALLVFDEIVTGFRYPKGSVQKALGIVPDITCLGKALASGMPLSAILGSQKLFLPAFHKTHFHPTFRGEVYSLAAARAAMQIYRSEPVAEHIWHHGRLLRQRIDAVSQELGVAGACSGTPFRLGFIFHESDAYLRRVKRSLLMQELVKQGVLTVGAMLLPSYAHDDLVLEKTVAAFRNALGVVADAARRNQLHQALELVVA